MPANNIQKLFHEHAGLIRNNVAKNITNSDFYLKHMSKEPWLDGQGTQYSYPIYERVLPTSPVAFSAWTSSNNEVGGQCLNNAGQTLDRFGITLRQTQLKKAALNSPDICLDDLQFAWQVEDQVRNIIRILTENTRWVWTNAYQDEYINAVSNYLTVYKTANSGIVNATRSQFFPGASDALATSATYGTASGTAMPTGTVAAKVGKLTWDVLEFVYEQMGYLGGSLNPYTRVDEMTPVYALVGDRFSFYDLKMEDSNVRDDFRYAFEGAGNSSPMMAAPGLSGTYRGFKFFTVEFPPRYTFDDTARKWTRIQPFADSVTGLQLGKGYEVSQAYKDAPFTDTVVYHADVLKILVPKPTGVGQLKYNPAYSWSGEFTWRNIQDRELNPDGNIGFFRALYAYGPKLLRPELGFVIRHRRCPRAVDVINCANTAVTA
jgi:hypothetical protein